MERAILVTVDLGKKEEWTAGERSVELKELARSAGAAVVREEIVKRHELSPACFIGKGKAEEFAVIAADHNIDIAIFNNDLTGTQQKNLEEIMRLKVVDRTQLILDIFARRAHTNEGKIQVELAQLLYLLPRLTGKGVALSRLGGGIGTRGPGEQKLEVDRRRIRKRIFKLEKELEDLSARRGMMRKKRGRFSILSVALIGYTNVGKSTLLNALTESEVIVQDKLFSTLDPTVRKYTLPNKQKILFVDTVGFLDRLPHHLIEAFKATLEEVAEADMLAHLIDISHPKAKEQASSVYRVLEEIGIKDKPVITVLNKMDKVQDKAILDKARDYFHNSVTISALKKDGLDTFIGKISEYVNLFMRRIQLAMPAQDQKTLNFLYENGVVIKKEYKEDKLYVEAEVPARVADSIPTAYFHLRGGNG